MNNTQAPECIRMAALALSMSQYPKATIEEQIEIARKIAAFYFGEAVTCH